MHRGAVHTDSAPAAVEMEEVVVHTAAGLGPVDIPALASACTVPAAVLDASDKDGPGCQRRCLV